MMCNHAAVEKETCCFMKVRAELLTTGDITEFDADTIGDRFGEAVEGVMSSPELHPEYSSRVFKRCESGYALT